MGRREPKRRGRERRNNKTCRMFTKKDLNCGMSRFVGEIGGMSYNWSICYLI